MHSWLIIYYDITVYFSFILLKIIKYMKLEKSDNTNKKFVGTFYDEHNKKVKTTHFGQKGSED